MSSIESIIKSHVKGGSICTVHASVLGFKLNYKLDQQTHTYKAVILPAHEGWAEANGLEIIAADFKRGTFTLKEKSK